MKRWTLLLTLLTCVAIALPSSADAAKRKKRKRKSTTETSDVNLEEIGVIKNQDIRVVQRRQYPKAGRTEVGFVLSGMAFDRYVWGGMAGGRVTLHRAENLALDISVLGGYGSGNLHYQEITSEVYAGAPGVRLATDAYRLLVGGHLGVEWTPFYAKVAVGGRRIFHHEVYLSGGISSFLTQELGASGVRPAVLGPQAAIGLRIFLSPKTMLRLELRDHLLFRPKPANPGVAQVLHNQIIASVGLSFWTRPVEGAQ